MYHYVRPIAESRYPGIKGLELQAFRQQLDRLGSKHTPVRAADVVAYVTEGKPLPDRPLLLTFDDGYRDHAQYVFPELAKRGWSGMFFPPGDPIEKRDILDVNKIHYVLASAKDVAPIVADLNSTIEDNRSMPGVRSVADLRQEFFKPNRFDPAEVNYIKRLLQFALPLELRATVTDRLFRQYVSDDPKSFADEIYLHTDDLKRMIDGGMEIGSHGTRHFWMNQLSKTEQAQDLDASLDFQKRLGLRTAGFFYCYPYGAYNTDTLALLRERHCGFAVTTKSTTLPLQHHQELLEVPRFDTTEIK